MKEMRCIKALAFTLEMDEETMLPRSYTLDFTRTCELIRERIEAEYDSLGAAVVPRGYHKL